MTPMTPRERVAAALNHREPDRVPVSLGGSANHIAEAAFIRLRDHLGAQDIPRRTLVGFYTTPDYNPLLDKLGTDIRYIHMRPPASYHAHSLLEPFEPFVDEWGLTHQLTSGYYDLPGAPLAERFTPEGIENYAWPDPYDPVRMEGVKEEVERLYNETDHAIVAHRPVYGNIWEMSRLLLGMEKALVATILEPKTFDALMWKLTEVLNGFYDAFLSVVGPYVQIVEMAEDLGTNMGPMVNPKFYREHIKPRHKETIALIKQKAPNAKVMLHCDGAIHAFLPDLIDAGFEALNPIESNLPGMNPADLKAEFGSEMVFMGGVDVREVLTRGSVEDVRHEVKLRIAQMAPGGGYICGPSHNFGNDMPLENILAFFEATREFGSYPLAFTLDDLEAKGS